MWDRYISESLKSSARTKRDKGMHRRVVGSPVLSGNWQNFLRVDLFRFFIENSFFRSQDKDVLATSGQNVLCTSSRIDVTSLEPCIHEEAVLLHASKTCIRFKK